MESYGPRRPRCPNWTEQDKIILVKNIKARKDILLAKNRGDANMKDAIALAWQEVLTALNAETHFPRTLEQVKKQHENLKLRAKQLYMDMLNCPGTVKPHIISPAMKLMMEDMAEADEEFLNPTPVANRVLLPKLPSTLPITLSPLNLPVQSVSAPSTVKYESDDSNTNTSTTEDTVQNHSISIQGNNAKFNSFPSATSDYISNPKKRKLDSQPDTLLESTELERIRAETEKFKAETELIYQRKEYEFAIFELKRQVLEAKLEYYTKANEKRAISEQTVHVKDSETSNKSSYVSEHGKIDKEKE